MNCNFRIAENSDNKTERLRFYCSTITEYILVKQNEENYKKLAKLSESNINIYNNCINSIRELYKNGNYSKKDFRKNMSSQYYMDENYNSLILESEKAIEDSLQNINKRLNSPERFHVTDQRQLIKNITESFNSIDNITQQYELELANKPKTTFKNKRQESSKFQKMNTISEERQS
jgi:hypothetical protein